MGWRGKCITRDYGRKRKSLQKFEITPGIQMAYYIAQWNFKLTAKPNQTKPKKQKKKHKLKKIALQSTERWLNQWRNQKRGKIQSSVKMKTKHNQISGSHLHFPVPTFKPHKEHKNDLIMHLKILKKCKQMKFKPGKTRNSKSQRKTKLNKNK